LKNIAIYAIISIQLFIAIYLSYTIYLKNKVQNRSVSPMKLTKTTSYSSNKLIYYYEPTSNTSETIENNWIPPKVTYTINSDSLNEQHDYNIKKGSKTYRIITLGDSFTFGDGVSTQDNWTELLEKELNSHYTCEGADTYEVINLGVRGYDTEYEVERFRLRGVKYEPDLVIWTFGDLKRFKELMYPLAQKLKNENIDYILQKEKEFYGYNLNKSQVNENTLLSVANGLVARSLTKEQIIERQNVLISSFDEIFNNPLLYIEINDADKEIVKKIFSTRLSSKKIFTTYSFKNEERLPDYHFNLEGHKKMMENTLSTLIINKLLPCQIIKKQPK